jgi:SAM-dependent methyltransferase
VRYRPPVSFFGELYLRSTRPLLTPEVTAEEVAYLARHLCAGDGLVLDLGCGHGRHASALARQGLQVVGVELDALSLREREQGFSAIRGDFRRLPIRSGALRGAYAWYSTLFVFDEGAHRALLRELARCLVPGGRLIFQSVPYERLVLSPRARFETTLPDGSVVQERSEFDVEAGVDRGERTLRLPDGRVLSGRYAIRYYPLPHLNQWLSEAGLRPLWAHGSLAGEPVTPQSTDLIVGAERDDG